MFDFLSVSLNSYKWLLTEQDALCWHVPQCHRVNSLVALSSPSRLLSTHKYPNQTHANTHTHTHVQPVHTHLQPHIHQPGLLSERLVHCDWLTDWAIHVHAPTISFHLGTKERGGGERQKNAGDDGGDSSCLFIWNIFSEGNRAEEKKFFFSPFIVEMMDLLSQ